MVDREFGTGAVKITPAHDPNDFEVGRRHKLAEIDVMTDDGRMNATAGAYAGMDRFEARKKIVEDLKALGLLEKITEHTNAIGLCERSKTIVEPRASTQWFCKMKPLAEPAIAAVERGDIKIVPDNRREEYFNWMRNIRDWTLSRQLWWGHRIPAWHCGNCAQTPDFKTYYPTSLLITGYEILFFWVARMIMLGIHFTGKIPFRTVYLHSIVRTPDGEKMSKSKGTGIDPIDVNRRYGTDAMRYTLAVTASVSDVIWTEDRIQSSRNFVNKIWNAARFLFVNLDKFEESGAKLEELAAPEVRVKAPYAYRGSVPLVDAWMFARLAATVELVNDALANYRFHEAAQGVYQFFWGDFCDWYIEWVKPELQSADRERATVAWKNLFAAFDAALRLLHPFMPFLTEELWHQSPQKGAKSIALDQFPEARKEWKNSGAENDLGLLQRVIGALRDIRAQMKIRPKGSVNAEFFSMDSTKRAIIEKNCEEIKRLANLWTLTVSCEKLPQEGGTLRSSAEFDVRILRIAEADAEEEAAEKARLKKQIEGLLKAIASKERQLGDETFRSRAPEKIIKGLEATLAEQQIELRKLQDRLSQLDGNA